ncbi:MAG: DNA/RNA nuclease SfsA [Gammaproteobacteria bacterium]|nr:DNA/RNA nuclease SfsA [Gammaproteobacteria bacterium]
MYIMKFTNALEKAVFLRRKSENIIEADFNTLKINIFCTNSRSLENCAVAGSEIWYSPPVYAPYYIPPIWQLVELDYGNLALVNIELLNELFIEGLKSAMVKIPDLVYKNLTINQHVNLFNNYEYHFGIRNNNTKKNIYINITGSERHYFPEVNNDCTELYDLIHAKMLGYEAVLCCFVLTEGVEQLNLTRKFNPEYAALLKIALDLGVKLLAYSVSLDLRYSEIKVAKSINIVKDRDF